MPSISVIIPTYNRPRQLALCLQALAADNFPHEEFEVIVVDDGGALPAGSAIDQLRLTLDLTVIRQDNGGVGEARNHGAKRARGKYLIFLDDDCFPERGWLRALAARLEKSPLEAVAGKTVNGCTDNVYDCASHLLSYYQYEHYENGSVPVEFLAPNNLAMPAALFHAAGGFHTDLRLAYEDREFCDRWLRTGYRLAYAPEAVVRHCRSMTLRSFCRQHWNYGRMASRYYREAAETAPSRIRNKLPRMFLDVARQAWRDRHGGNYLPVLALVAMSQVTSAIAFVVERFS